MQATYTPQKSIEWLSQNPATFATLERYTMILKKISVQGYHLLMDYLDKLLTHPLSMRTVETSTAVRKYMSKPKGIGQAAELIADLMINIKHLRQRFERAVMEQINSVAEQPVLLNFFDMLILYTHCHVLPCES